MPTRLTNHCQKTIQLENALSTPIRFSGRSEQKLSLLDRMTHQKVPSVSLALIDNGEVAWTKSWGLKSTETGIIISPNMVFQPASMSKQVAAFAALQLVETGCLSLNEPINSYLKRWRLPENDLTRQEPVTLAHLLSHTAGTTVHGFRGYAKTDVQPSTKQVLDGNASAASAPVLVDTLPGSAFRYSGGGTTVVQMAMEDVCDQPFAQIIQERLLGPVGMTQSTFKNPLPDSFAQDAAYGHLSDGQVVPGKWHNYPIQAAAGLWCTPRDMAKFLLAVMQAWRGTDDALLSKSLVDQYLSEHLNAWGLGPRLFIQDGKTIGFHHGGANEGFRCNSDMFLDGRGAVVMTNSDQGDPLVAEIMATLATLYDWPECQPKEQAWLPLTAEERSQLGGTFVLTYKGARYETHIAYQDQGLNIQCQSCHYPVPFIALSEKGIAESL